MRAIFLKPEEIEVVSDALSRYVFACETDEQALIAESVLNLLPEVEDNDCLE